MAGSGAFCAPVGPASKTETKAGGREALSSPHSAAFVPAGIIVDDRDDNRIRLLTGTGLHAA